MATINNVIAYVNQLKPNGYGDDEKAAWLRELDGKIALEVMGLPAPQYTPEEWDNELLVSAPYDNIYWLYILSMMDFANEEFDNYANSRAMFSSAMGEYRRWYRRTHLPLGDAVLRNVM